MHAVAQWFVFGDSAWAHCIPWDHNPWLLLLAYVVAAFAAYTAFGVLERVTTTRRLTWIAMGGLAMGFGIWSMHFIAMLAVRIDLPVRFDLLVTVVSAAWAIGASALALAIVGRPSPPAGRIVMGGLVLGLGVVVMHYAGMAALRMPADVAYDPAFFLLSVGVAVGLSIAALWALGALTARIPAAAVMGGAIVLMHATGMFGTGFFPDPNHVESGFAVTPEAMAAAIVAVNAGLVLLAMVAARLDRHAGQAREMLADAVDSFAAGLAIYDPDDRLVMCNDRYRAYHPSATALLTVGRPHAEIFAASRDGGDYPDAPGTWDRLRSEARGAMEVRLCDASWALCSVRRMRNGGIAELWTDITTLKRAQGELAASEARLDRAQQIAKIGSWDLDVATGRYDYSKQMFLLRGLDPRTFTPTLDTLRPYIHAEDLPRMADFLQQLRETGAVEPIEVRNIRPDGSMFIGRMVAQGVWDASGKLVTGAGTTQDVTEQRATERQLALAQKMDALGQLTGGMAHDFNNMLGVVLGNLDMLKRQVLPGSLAAELCTEAVGGAERCAELIRRLLAFSRRQPLRADRTDVNGLVGDISRLLERTLGEQVTILLKLAPGLWPVLVDGSQLEAALVNIATNARDAMPRGGTLMIRTRNTELDRIYASLHPEVTAGDYVLIEISDTGTGIPADVIPHIFEPFFTTKDVGKGTGLGLSMAFGFVKQSGGHLAVYSEEGLGTTFLLYLPRADGEPPVPREAGSTPPADAPQSGSETVLLVEDNFQLRRAALRQLGMLGYPVLEAEDGTAALAVLASGAAVDIVFSDVVMPGPVDGLELALRAQQMRPGIKVLLTSGFPGVRSAGHRLAESPFTLLSKPYSTAELALALREELDGGSCTGTAEMAQPGQQGGSP